VAHDFNNLLTVVQQACGMLSRVPAVLGESAALRWQIDDARLRAMTRIELSDSGYGMAPEVLARATEPFFSTKEPGRGSGLGLSAAEGFVRQSGGWLQIRSERGRGTTVIMILPQSGPE
jgi:signal transduction histidine kinase